MSVRQPLIGAEAFKAKLKRSMVAAPAAIVAAEKVIAETVIFPDTQAQVPRDTGALAQSGRVVVDGMSVLIAYGTPGDVTDIYAIIQHEREDFNHPGGGKAKFVSDPVSDAAGAMAGLLDGALTSQQVFP